MPALARNFTVIVSATSGGHRFSQAHDRRVRRGHRGQRRWAMLMTQLGHQRFVVGHDIGYVISYALAGI